MNDKREALGTTPTRLYLDGDTHVLCDRVAHILAGPEGNREIGLIFRILPPCGWVAGVAMAGNRCEVPA